MKHNKWGLILLVALLLLIPVVSQAQTEAWIVNGIDTSGCGNFNITLNVTFVNDGGTYNFDTVAIVDGLIYMHENFGMSGLTGTTTWSIYSASSGGPITGTWPMPAGRPVEIYLTMERPVNTPVAQTLLVLDACETSNILYNGDPAGWPLPPASGAAEAQPFTDGRLNDRDAAAPVAVYEVDGDLHVYAVDSSEGTLVMVVTAEEFAAVGVPEVNTVVEEANGIQVIRLSTGEYQINAPTASGKTYTMIFSGLAPGNYTSFEA